MKNTSIEWCDHTWNPWRGCTRVEYPKCGDPAEWPKDLRVRQFPEGL